MRTTIAIATSAAIAISGIVVGKALAVLFNKVGPGGIYRLTRPASPPLNSCYTAHTEVPSPLSLYLCLLREGHTSLSLQHMICMFLLEAPLHSMHAC